MQPQGPRPASAPAPYIAVNGLDALLPLGRTRGLLTVINGCVTFKVRDQLYMPVWPAGTKLSSRNDAIIAPGGEVFPLGKDATLGGASFSLANEGMRLRDWPPSPCPDATYAVHL